MELQNWDRFRGPDDEYTAQCERCGETIDVDRLFFCKYCEKNICEECADRIESDGDAVCFICSEKHDNQEEEEADDTN